MWAWYGTEHRAVMNLNKCQATQYSNTVRVFKGSQSASHASGQEYTNQHAVLFEAQGRPFDSPQPGMDVDESYCVR